VASPILPVNTLRPVELANPAGIRPVPDGAAAPGEFRTLLEGAVRSVEDARGNATASVERLLSGQAEELHQTVLATQRAEISFELFLQVRNKVVQAYQEVMRMQM
jgi:flagellar hook-basal body complex protein FliE